MTTRGEAYAGLSVAVVTPLRDGAVDFARIKEHVEFQVAAGTALTFHAYAHRLADRIHDLQTTADLMLIVRDAQGTVSVVSLGAESRHQVLDGNERTECLRVSGNSYG